jgi:hypothetical protein
MNGVKSSNIAAIAAAALALIGTAAPAAAQAAAEKDVVAVVEKTFTAMLARDTAGMKALFDPNARLVSGVTRDGVTTVSYTSMNDFIAGVGRGTGPGANERIYAPEVRIDGNLAAVWTFYTLHVGDRFIHCGVDAFHLIRGDKGWKIVAIADTRRTENCDPPGGAR